MLLVYEGAALLFGGVILAVCVTLYSLTLPVPPAVAVKRLVMIGAVVVVFAIFVVNGMRGGGGFRPVNIGYGTYFADITPFVFICLGASFVNLNERQLIRLLKCMVAMSLITVVPMIGSVDAGAVAQMGARELAVGDDMRFGYVVVMTHALFLTFAGYALLCFVDDWKWRIVAMACFASAAGAALLYSKRATLATMIIACPWFLYKHIRRHGMAGLVVLLALAIPTAAIAAVVLSGDRTASRLADMLEERIYSANSLADVDRLYEVGQMFAASSWRELLIGSGLCSYQNYAGWFWNTTIHVGWANIIFKGGFVLLLLLIVLATSATIGGLRKTGVRRELCALAAVIMSIEWLHSTGWGVSISGLLLSMISMGFLLSGNGSYQRK